MLNLVSLVDFCSQQWAATAIPELIEYIRIPNKSPAFDPAWERNGYMEQAVRQFSAWAVRQGIPGLQLEVVRLPGRTPLIYIDIPGAADNTVLLYGHLDKQPEMSGWREGLGPWTPVREGGKLYGRGGADDGYALFGSLIAIQALQRQGIPHARCVVLIEASEESGSPDLPFYMEALAARIGNPELVICLDSGCGNYDQLWNTTSLRGVISGTLRVDILREGVHSGDASGVVPSSFRIVRQLLDRLEDSLSGDIRPAVLQVDIPLTRIEQAMRTADVLGDEVFTKFPFADGAQPAVADGVQLILNRTWRATLSITGADGLPTLENAGNVLRPFTTVKLSIRLPPTCDAEVAATAVKTLLEENPPSGARVRFNPQESASGWHAPAMAGWLEQALNDASLGIFGRPAAHMGEGGTIPFMGMLGARYPAAQFLITGVLGPQSNAHGPNEFLHIPTAEKVTACVAKVLADHYSANLSKEFQHGIS